MSEPTTYTIAVRGAVLTYDVREPLTRGQAIARACLGLLQDGDSVFLDTGTTVEALARALAEDGRGLRLSVLTSSLAPSICPLIASPPGAASARFR